MEIFSIYAPYFQVHKTRAIGTPLSGAKLKQRRQWAVLRIRYLVKTSNFGLWKLPLQETGTLDCRLEVIPLTGLCGWLKGAYLNHWPHRSIKGR